MIRYSYNRNTNSVNNDASLNLLGKRYQGNIPDRSRDKSSVSYWVKIIFRFSLLLFAGFIITIITTWSVLQKIWEDSSVVAIPWDLEVMSTSSYEIPSIALNNGYSVNTEWLELWKSRKKLFQLEEILTLIYSNHKDEFNDLIVSIEKHENMDFIELLEELEALESDLDKFFFLWYTLNGYKEVKDDIDFINLLSLKDGICGTLKSYRELFQTMDTWNLKKESRILISNFLNDTEDIRNIEEIKIYRFSNIRKMLNDKGGIIIS